MTFPIETCALYITIPASNVGDARTGLYIEAARNAKALFDEFLAPFYRKVIPVIHEYGIPVFIDSRADLYTKQFSSFENDIFDDYEFILSNYQSKFEFYGITHALIYKKDNPFYPVLKKDDNYEILYEDDYFCLFEKISSPDVIITYS